MKKLFILFLVLTSHNLLFGQDVSTFKPSKPKISDKLTITYDSKIPYSVLKDAKNVNLQIAFWRSKAELIFNEIPMKMSGDKFTSVVKIPNDSVVYITYKFVSGEKKDDNDGNWWETFIYEKNGKIREGAHYQKSISFSYPYDLERKKDELMMKSELKLEIAQNKKYLPALTRDWSLRLREARGKEKELSTIKDEISGLYKTFKHDDESLGLFLSAADFANMKDLSDQIKEYSLKKYPAGKTVANFKFTSIMKEQNLEKRMSDLKAFLKDFTNISSQMRQYGMTMLYDIYYQQKKNDDIKELLKTVIVDNPYYVQRIVTNEIKRDEIYKEFLEFISNNIKYFETNRDKLKPYYMSVKSWDKEADINVGSLLGIKGKSLLKINEIRDAQNNLEKAFELTNSENEEINSSYVEALVKNKLFEKAMEISSLCVKKGKSTKELIKNWEFAYISGKGTSDGFKEILSKIETEQFEVIKQKILSEKINKPAPDFQLKDFKGNVIKLSDLRGKVVLIDFWATWCGPCKSSFPFLQQAYEKYKNNDKVTFLVVNTWERVPKEDREKTVKKFIEDTKYTFPVIYDDDSYSVVGKYEVSGIPTKFMVDQNGNIQFKSVGFDKGEDMLKEIDIWVDVLTK